jgi:hypothetical protein
MNDAQEDNLFPLRQPKRNLVSLTPKELAILRLADAYGVSDIAAAKLILALRDKQKAADAHNSRDATMN